MRKWTISEPAADIGGIKSAYGDFLGELLLRRGISTNEKAAEYFACDSLSDPYLIKDMEQAVEIINTALDSGEKITVFGDYDCDGVTATVMLFDFLEQNGAEVDYYIPERSEGYGMNIEALKKIAARGTRLIITVDNGISAIEEAKYLKEQGIRLVITDHHQVPEELPVCDACVNPHRPDDSSQFKDLCGAGVVLKLLCALTGDEEFILERYAELAAIGTVGDVMPLTVENRYIVCRGLDNIRNSQIAGISSLLKIAGVTADKINSTTLSFTVCPRINAAGRMAAADKAAQLIMPELSPDRARLLAEELVQYNTDRRETEARILEEIERSFAEEPMQLKQRVIVASGEGWHHGVVGIVCSRIVEKYGKPVLLISIENGEARGSARSIEGFSIYKLLNSCADILTKYGGHPKAGGFSLEAARVEEFRQRVYEYARVNYPKMPDPVLTIDMELDGRMLTPDNIKKISKLEPFGEGNKQPVFLLRGCKVLSKRSLKDGKYYSMEIESAGVRLKALDFTRAFAEMPLAAGSVADIVATVDSADSSSNPVTLKICDIRSADFREDRFFAAKRVYEDICRGEDFDKRLAPRIIPDREALKGVFDLLRKYSGLSAEDICVFGGDMNYCMLRVALDAFAQAGMLKMSPAGDGLEILPVSGKRDLFSQGILAELKRKCGE
ncbi:MAG: single-stranded-DNA-specific exonuclease RecJ [Oscillospiraceae bacterium]